MPKPTVYIETTIVSYLAAWPSRDITRYSHQLLTRQWWDHARPSFDPVTSDFVIQEASAGDANAAAARLTMLDAIPSLPLIEPTVALAGRLVTALALPSRARLDAAHVAIAAVHGVPYLLTWNCRHLANGALADKIEQACAAFGFVAPRVLTPETLMEAP